jgi:hypothetical protein
MPVTNICFKAGISQVTWLNRLSGTISAIGTNRLNRLEATGNTRQLVAELSLERERLHDVIRYCWLA